jgi:hypothetical protein
MIRSSGPIGGAAPTSGYPGGMTGSTPVLLAPGSKPSTPAAPAAYTGQSTWQAPQYISADSTQSAVNNRMGQAQMMGDQRLFQKQFARNGLGASKGTDYFSQIGQQQALGQGRAESAGIAAQDQANNAKSRLDFQFGREREAQALAMVQHALSQSNWSTQFAQQQAAAQIAAAQQNAYINFFR